MALPLADRLTEHVFRTGQTLVRGDISSQSRFPRDAEHKKLNLRSSIALPLVSKGRIIGSWVLGSQALNAYGEREQAILERLANHVAPAVENALLYEQTLKDQEELQKLSQPSLPANFIYAKAAAIGDVIRCEGDEHEVIGRVLGHRTDGVVVCRDLITGKRFGVGPDVIVELGFGS